MLEQATIALIGSGAMGEAIIKVLLDKALIEPGQLIAADALPDRCAELAKQYAIRTTADNAAAASEAEIVILAVKPQVLPAVLRDLENATPSSALIISIIAGARIETLVQGLGNEAVVRSMPNTPAQIGEGMVVWTATPAASEAQRQQAQSILQAMGQAIYVREEKQLDMATAINGSGPAYVFLFMEAMVDAGVRLGFSRPVAKQLVLQTVLGSTRYAIESGAHLADLRNKVTSPGGTTAEALYQFERCGLRAALYEAIQAAYDKSQGLGK